MLCPIGKNFGIFLSSACLSVDSIPIYRYKSGPEADFGLVGWDWAGRRLDIRGELGQQVQRSASATPSRASSMCSPQPDHVAFLQISRVTFEHIGWLL
jgi:hypothetical protein